MKLNFNLKDKQASLEADVEGLVEKGLMHKANNPNRKTRYQIKQEEKRKNEELKHKQQMQYMFILLGLMVFFLIVGIIATILGTMGAIGAFYSKRRVKTFLNSANQVPIINADVVTGFSICVLLIIVLGMEKDTFIPLIAGHVTLCAPFVYTAVVPKLKQMDNSLYEAALDLGCSPSKALFKVVIPQLIPGIISGFMLAITLSLDDYFITTYTKPATFDTISTYVVNATRGSQTNIKTALWALSTVIFAIVILAVVVMNFTSLKKKEEE